MWVNFQVNKSADTYIAKVSKFEDGINFSMPHPPHFVKSYSGISIQENWGRWTNANSGEAIITFKKSLPEQFYLNLTAISYGPNSTAPTQIIIGNSRRDIVISGEQVENYQVFFDGIKDERKIEIRPPFPISPHQLNPSSNDGRMLGIGLIKLQIIAK